MSGPRPSAPTVELTCHTCRVVFTRLKRNVIPGRGGYCSHKCAGVHTPRADAVTNTCQRCGVSFQIKAHRIKQGKGKFCSRACVKNPPPSVLASTGAPVVATPAPAKFKRVRVAPQPTSITPKYLDRLPENDWTGATVRCARCEQPRARGTFCPTCEPWAYEGEAS